MNEHPGLVNQLMVKEIGKVWKKNFNVLQTHGTDIDAIITRAVDTAAATTKTNIAGILNSKLYELQKDPKAKDDKLVALKK